MKYLLTPLVSPYPLTVAEKLQKVKWDCQKSMYVEICPGYVEGRVCGTSYYGKRLSKILKYVTVLAEVLE